MYKLDFFHNQDNYDGKEYNVIYKYYGQQACVGTSLAQLLKNHVGS